MGILDRLVPSRRDGFAVTAAATIIENDDEAERTRIRRGPSKWQREAWDAYDDEDGPEIAYAANYQSNAISMVRLVPAVRTDPREAPTVLDPDGDDDLDLSDDERAAMDATIGRLGSGPLSMSELVRLLEVNLFVAGEAYLCGYEEGGTEVWDAVSVEELVQNPNGTGYARRAPDGGVASAESLPDDAFIVRLYQRHPRHSRRAYSSVKSVLGLARELRTLTWGIEASAASRIPAGVMLLPHGLRAGPRDESMIGQRDEGQQDPTVKQIQEHFETPRRNPRSAASISPLQLWGEINDLKEVRVVNEWRDVDAQAAAQRSELIGRIATGLDLPVEVLTGKADLNHWSAWLVSDETFKYHLEPDVRVLVDALTVGYYRPHLEKMGIEAPQRHCVWYDASPLTTRPNQTQDYKDGYDRFEVSGEAYRRVAGIPDEDKPEPEEVAARLWRGALERTTINVQSFPTPEQIEAGLEGEDVELEEAPREAVAPQETPAEAPTTPENTPRGPARTPTPGEASLPPLAALTASATLRPLGPRLAAIEQALRLQLQTAASAAMERLLERAGNRLRSLANKSAPLRAKVAGIDPIDVGATLGSDAVASLATSTDDVVTAAGLGTLGAQWDRAVRRAQEQGLAAIDDRGDLDDTDAQRIAEQMERGRSEGWPVLEAGLLALAATLLFDPHAPPPARGEWSEFLVPPGVVRDALDEAGGRGDVPGGGVLGGATVHDALDRAGLLVAGWVWRHGDPEREFPPHADLDGTEFTDFGDDALVNNESWPETEFYYPEDHAGCSCYAEAIIEGAAEEPAPESEPATLEDR